MLARLERARAKADKREDLLAAHKTAAKDDVGERRFNRLKELDDRRSAFRDAAQDRTDAHENERPAEWDRDSTDD